MDLRVFIHMPLVFRASASTEMLHVAQFAESAYIVPEVMVCQQVQDGQVHASGTPAVERMKKPESGI